MKLLILCWLFPALVMAQGFGIATLVKGSPIVEDSAGLKKPLAKGGKVFESDTIITSANSLVRLVMMDTNVIDIYPNSKVLIKEYIYKPKENQKNVSLEVTEGRIKSTVKQKYDNDKNKFNVKTPVIVAGVRGTIFFTGHEPKSGLSHVLTQEGNVMVGKIEANQQVKEFFSVKANQKIEIKDKQLEQPKVQEVPKADIEKQKAEDNSAGFAKFGNEKGSDGPRGLEASNDIVQGSGLVEANPKAKDNSAGFANFVNKNGSDDSEDPEASNAIFQGRGPVGANPNAKNNSAGSDDSKNPEASNARVQGSGLVGANQKAKDNSAGFAKFGKKKGSDDSKDLKALKNRFRSSGPTGGFKDNEFVSSDRDNSIKNGSAPIRNDQARKISGKTSDSDSGSNKNSFSKQEGSKQERPKQERPKQERPKQERVKQERVKQERVKQERVKQERPKQERPKQERPKPDSDKHGGGGKKSGGKKH